MLNVKVRRGQKFSQSFPGKFHTEFLKFKKRVLLSFKIFVQKVLKLIYFKQFFYIVSYWSQIQVVNLLQSTGTPFDMKNK